MTDGSGAVSDAYRYTAFGEELTTTGTSENPYRFGGQFGYYRDTPDRLYVRSRHLQPATGRWLSVDPVPREPRYHYAYNNPLAYQDPAGEQAGLLPLAPLLIRAGYRQVRSGSPILPAPARRAIKSVVALPVTVIQGVLDTSEVWVRDSMQQRRGDRGGGRQFSSLITSPFGSAGMGAKLVLDIALEVNRPLQQRLAARWNALHQALPAAFHNLFPPPPGTFEADEYAVGFVWGAAQTLIGLLPYTWILDLLEVLVWLAEQEVTWSALGEFGKVAFGSLLAGILERQDLEPWDRGKIAGILLVSLVLFVLLLVTVAGAAIRLAGGWSNVKALLGLVRNEARAGAQAKQVGNAAPGGGRAPSGELSPEGRAALSKTADELAKRAPEAPTRQPQRRLVPQPAGGPPLPPIRNPFDIPGFQKLYGKAEELLTAAKGRIGRGAPGGNRPWGRGGFQSWFDNAPLEEFLEAWKNPVIRESIEANLR
jgi:RHS repeat-associated protein